MSDAATLFVTGVGSGLGLGLLFWAIGLGLYPYHIAIVTVAGGVSSHPQSAPYVVQMRHDLGAAPSTYTKLLKVDYPNSSGSHTAYVFETLSFTINEQWNSPQVANTYENVGTLWMTAPAYLVTPKTVTVKVTVQSRCPLPEPWVFFCGEQTANVTPPSGSNEDPSSVQDIEHTFTVEAADSNACGVKTASGAILWQTAYFKTPLPNSQTMWKNGSINFACDEAPEPPTTEEMTDVGTGTTTTTTQQNTPTPPGTAPGETTIITREETILDGGPGGGGTANNPPTRSQNTAFYENPDTADMTKQDFYDATRQALVDAGNSGTVPPSFVQPELAEGTGDGLGGIDEAETSLRDSVTAFFTSARAFVEGLGDRFDALPSPGQSLTFSLGTAPPFGAIKWDATPFSGVAALIRAAFLLVISLLFIQQSVLLLHRTFKA